MRAQMETNLEKRENERGMQVIDTILVPYSMACLVWKVPFLPVMPWHMTRVFLSTKTAGGGGEAGE